MPYCNTTLEDGYINETPLFHGYTFHNIGLALCAAFGLISIIIALVLMFGHATNYTKPWEQRQIIRILFMIPIYSLVSFLSYLYYRHSVYFEVLRDCYEAFAIASFFSLLCAYVAPTLHEQKEYFRGITPKNWVLKAWGMQYCTGGEYKGPFRKPRSGLTWFNICWIGIFQYCLIRVFFTLVALVTEVFNRYCEASMSPAFAHVWVTAFEAISVTIAMTFLIQFYVQLKEPLADQKPFMKVLAIKLVIFFSFWQTLVISAVSSDTHGVLHASDSLSYQDIKIGIGNILLCVEMAFFAILHIFAFPWKPYRSSTAKKNGGPLGIKAFFDAFNPWDFVTALARGLRWLFVGVKHREQDVSYQKPLKSDNGEEYSGPTFAGSGEPATELQAGKGSVDDDRAGLLGKSGGIPTAHPTSAYQPPVDHSQKPYDGPPADPRYEPSSYQPYRPPQPIHPASQPYDQGPYQEAQPANPGSLPPYSNQRSQ